MNPEFPQNPREEIELRISALLLGELSDSEAAQVRAAMAQDPALAKLYDELKQTILVVRETTAARSSNEVEAAPKLSETKRKQLFTAFTIPPLKAKDQEPRRLLGLGLVEMAAILAIVILLAGMLFPAITSSKARLAATMYGKREEETLAFISAETVDEAIVGGRPARGNSRERSEPAVQTASDPFTATLAAKAALEDLNLPVLPTMPAETPPISLGQEFRKESPSELAIRQAYVPARKNDENADTSLLSDGTTTTDGRPKLVQLGQIALPGISDSPDSKQTQDKIPVLGDVPVLGQAFVKQDGLNRERGANDDYFAVATPSPTLGGTEAKPLASFGTRITREPTPYLGGDDDVGLAINNPKQRQLDRVAGAELDALNLGRGFFDQRAASGATVASTPSVADPVTGLSTYGFAVTPTESASKDPVSGFPVANSSLAATENFGVTPGSIAPATPAVVWGDSLHQKSSSVGSQEGAVQQLTRARLHEALRNSGDLTAGISGPLSFEEPTLERAKQVKEEQITAGTRINNARALLEANRPEEADKELQAALATDPENQTARYYRSFVNESRSRAAEAVRSKDLVVKVEREWTSPQPSKSNDRLETQTFDFKAGRELDALQSEPGVSTPPPRVFVATGEMLAGAGGGGGGGQIGAGGVRFLTRTNQMQQVQEATQKLFESAGVDLNSPGEAVFYNDRAGKLFVRGSKEDLEKVGQVVEALAANKSKAEIAQRLAEIKQGDLTDQPEAEVAETKLAANTPQLQRYAEKKRELEEAYTFERILGTKLAAERIDLSIPRTTMVEIVDNAEPAIKKSGGLRGLGIPIGGTYASSARITTEPQTTEVAKLSGAGTVYAYDPYYVELQSEIIKSDFVLGKVAESLDLNTKLSKRTGGQKLSTPDAIGLLKGKLSLSSVKNTGIMEIRATDEDPQLAADIANAVAEIYREHHLSERRHLIQGGISTLVSEHEKQVGKVAQARRELEELRQQFNVSDVDTLAVVPTPSLEAESPRRYQAQLIEASSRLADLEVTLAKLKSLPPQELKQALPRMRSDEALTGLMTQLSAAEEQLGALRRDQSVASPDLASAQTRIAELRKQVDENVTNIMAALDNQLESSKAAVTKLQEMVDTAKKEEIAQAEKARPYYDKKRELEQLLANKNAEHIDQPMPRRAATNAPIPQPEIQTRENNFSTFSLNVSDVSFKLVAASLEQGQMPDAASVRAEEFLNAFDYRDPEPVAGAPIGFAWERARNPFAHNRDLLRLSLKTAAAGRQAGRPLNVVLLLDNSGSMERADRVRIIQEALRVLGAQLNAQDKLSVITFARTAHLVADGVAGDKASEVTDSLSGVAPQGGTNLEEAMQLAYATAARHYFVGGINRVVLLTDGAANLGDVEPESLKRIVEAKRVQGIALDCFGIGWEGFNDDLLEVLSRNGDGRYGFINSPEEAATDFVGQLAGALQVAASDVKVQVEFNPKRVTTFRQIGYAKHQLTKEQFRDNTVDAAEIAAQEAGNALYTVEVNPAGEGPLGIVRVRYKIPGTSDYREQAWPVPYAGNANALEQSSAAMRLATTSSGFAEWLVASPFASEVTPDRLLGYLNGVPEIYGADARPGKLEWMIRQAKSIEGK